MRARDSAVTVPGMWAVLTALDVALAVAWIPLAGFARQLTVANVVSEVVVVVGYLCVGALVARRQPANPIGWLLLVFVLLVALSTDAGYYAVLAYRLGHQALPAAPLAVLLQPLYILATAVFPLIIVLFPDGRLSRRWRRAAWADRGRVRGADQGRRGPGRGANRSGRRCARGPGARARVGMGQQARLTPVAGVFPGRSGSRYTLLT